jgi:hypothetical protein
VAASGVTDELTALEGARSRLEAALAGDENWRALQQSPGQGQSEGEGEEADASATRRARNTRLKMALAENPLYQAWKHLGEAIAALRASGADAERPAGSGELPEEIASLLRDHASQDAPPDADKPAEPPGKPEQAAPDALDASPPIEPPAPAAAAGKSTADEDCAPRPHPNGRAVADQEEATVMFVRREPLLPSAQLPADLGTERATALFERLRGLEEEQELAATETAFAPPKDAEEAEVSIVSVEAARLRREAEERAGTIRRLRKALSGD